MNSKYISRLNQQLRILEQSIRDVEDAIVVARKDMVDTRNLINELSEPLPPAGIVTLLLNRRTYNALACNKITTVDQLASLTRGQLLRLPCIGKVLCDEIEAALLKWHNLTLNRE